MEILYGAHVLMTWYFKRADLCDHDRILIESTIARNPKWVRLFFDGVEIRTLNGDELMKSLLNNKQGKLLCSSVYWALHK